MKFTNCQKKAIKKIDSFMETKEHFFVISGYAGTGKTTIAAEIAKKYYDEYEIICVAPTHKATGVISQKISDALNNRLDYRNSMTFHKLLKYKADEINFFKNDDSKVKKKKIISIKTRPELWEFYPHFKWEYNEKEEEIMPTIKSKILIIIDEISMFSKNDVDNLKKYMHMTEENKIELLKLLKLLNIEKTDENEDYIIENLKKYPIWKKHIFAKFQDQDNEILNDIFKKIDLEIIEDSQVKIILLGDTSQLPPVEESEKVSESFQLANPSNYVCLKEIVRAKEYPYLLELNKIARDFTITLDFVTFKKKIFQKIKKNQITNKNIFTNDCSLSSTNDFWSTKFISSTKYNC